MKHLALIAAAQSLLALIIALIWFWYAMWHIHSVGAMADDLIIDGYITQAAADAARGEAASLGVYLQGGHDARSMFSGLALAAVAVLSPLVMLVAARITRSGRP